jgi:hypothetical protein
LQQQHKQVCQAEESLWGLISMPSNKPLLNEVPPLLATSATLLMRTPLGHKRIS